MDKQKRQQVLAGAAVHDSGGYEIGNPEDHAAFVAERNKSLMFDFHEAILRMHKGAVVKYYGTVNGNVFTGLGATYCMQRGVVFRYRNGAAVPESWGCMVYDPDFRYVDTLERIEPRGWPEKPKKDREIRSKLGYSRVGLKNV